jgi:hypothetical protein
MSFKAHVAIWFGMTWAHAGAIIKEFGGERMHPSERGKGKNWARWRKERADEKP